MFFGHICMLEMCSKTVAGDVNSFWASGVFPMEGLIYNLIQGLGVSRLTTERLPFQSGNPHHAGGNQCRHHRTDTRPYIKKMQASRPPAKRAAPSFFHFLFHTQPKKEQLTEIGFCTCLLSVSQPQYATESYPSRRGADTSSLSCRQDWYNLKHNKGGLERKNRTLRTSE